MRDVPTPRSRSREGPLAAALAACALGCTTIAGPEPVPGPEPSGSSGGGAGSGTEPLPVAIGADGYFYLDGERTIVFGAEEEHHLYTSDEVDALVPLLADLGVVFLVLYVGNPQEDFFYERLEAAGLWVAQDLGNVKKLTLSPFAATGGVIGTLPDEETIEENLARIDLLVVRLARFRNILFWWMGGEVVEPEFHTPEGTAALRASIARYAAAVEERDPLRRPFTVSHHFVEAVEDPLLPFVDWSDLTDFTWFTVATHFHAGDFADLGPETRWLPVAAAAEPAIVLHALLERAWELSGRRPIFFGGWYGQAPLWGPCTAGGQAEALPAKWEAIRDVAHLGGSSYHLSSWDDNAIPHALAELRDGAWTLTPAGAALRDVVASEPDSSSR